MSAEATALKKRRILDSARRLLIKRGFQDIVLDDVAREAGVAKGTLFLYYRSKDDLFSAAFGDLVDQLGAELEALPGSGKRGEALLAETIRVILSHFDKNRDFMSQFSVGRFPGCGDKSSGRLMDKFRHNARRMVAILKVCSEDGVVGRGDLGLAGIVLFGLCRSSILHRALSGKEEALGSRVRKVLVFFLRGAGGGG